MLLARREVDLDNLMSTIVGAPRSPLMHGVRPGLPFALAALVVAGAAALLTGWLPVWFAVVSVFLFAGPHNWLELRYFMGRMPARWGRLRGYFLFAFAGIIALSLAWAGLTVLFHRLSWSDVTAYEGNQRLLFHTYAVWNSVFVLWIASLVQFRSRQNPRRDWSWIWPLAFLLIALTWLDPFLWSFGMVYGHPLVAFWVLDRELKRSRPEWRPAYHLALLAVPVLLGLLWLRLRDADPLSGTDTTSMFMTNMLGMQIAEHAGDGTIRGVSNHFLVSSHTFLELLHYGVWVIVIPLIAYRAQPWKMDVPLSRRSPAWKRGLLVALGAGVVVLVVLWGAFLIDYPATREVYFTLALFHVLAEIPFLLRSL